ncbi:MAG: dihydroorotate dehydrogenase electron transfer subunit [Endomicrobiia bacterium]
MAKLYQLDLEILENKSISPFHKILVLRDKKIGVISQPGQFITILTNKILRRPFCISSVKKDKIEILYKIVGEGTKWLSERKKGEKINVIGPLGSGLFNYSLLPSSCSLLFVAGGTGIASLRFLAQKFSRAGLLFYGAKTKKEIVGLDIFIQKKWKINIATEDGSCGYKGTVIELLNKYLSDQSFNHLSSYVYSAGPEKMLKSVSEICKKHGIKGQVSLEKIIACGVGACRGCVVETKDGEYKSVCKDGPVFDIQDVFFSI